MSGPSPTLRPHQLEELEFLRGTPRGLLLSEMGCGKSAVLLHLANDHLINGERVLFLTKKSLVAQICDEATLWGLPQPSMVDGKDAERSPFIVASHHITPRRQWLTEQQWGLVLVDEATIVSAAATGDAVIASAIRELIHHHSDASVLATGTPIGSKHGLDLYSLAEVALLPGLMPAADYQQAVTYGTSQVSRWKSITKPVSVNPDAFRELVATVQASSTWHRLDDVADLPPIEVIHHPVPISADAAAAYLAAEQNPSSLRAHQGKTAAARDIGVLIPKVLELVQAHADDSIVLYAETFDLIEPLQQILTAVDVTTAVVTGRETAKARSTAMAAFSSGAARALLISSAGELGLNAAKARVLISLIQSYSPSREYQRSSRIRRLNSEHSSLLHHIVRPDVSTETRKDWILTGKENQQRFFWALMNGSRCPHGQLVERTGRSKGKPWAGLFCGSGACEPIWM